MRLLKFLGLIKVLFLNTEPPNDIATDNIVVHHKVTDAAKGEEITPHDYHVIIICTDDFTYYGWPTTRYSSSQKDNYDGSMKINETIGKRIEEQLVSGGIVFAFCEQLKYRTIEATYSKSLFKASTYGWCPIDLGVVNEIGDTISILDSNLGYLKPLFTQLDVSEIEWKAHFSKNIKNSKVLATNRAGYTVSEEIPIGSGRLVILPRFKERNRAIKIILKEIVPQIVTEEERSVIPPWVSDHTPLIEEKTQNVLNLIRNYKKLLYAKGRQLEKAVKLLFEGLGYDVKEIQEKDKHDLELFFDGEPVIIEIKGHDKRRTDREEILQLLGVITGEDKKDRRVFISNHEREKPPKKRSKEAFTEEAISTAENNKIGLVSTVELWNLALNHLKGKIDEPEMKNIRNKIMNTSGIIHF